MLIKTLIDAGKVIYDYDEDDLSRFRQAYRNDPDGLESSLAADPLIQFYLKYGYINEVAKVASSGNAEKRRSDEIQRIRARDFKRNRTNYRP
jgi:hypothetical protein